MVTKDKDNTSNIRINKQLSINQRSK